MAVKPKKFRVAVAGDTVDGRTIEPAMLTQSVETFNRETYGVRVNVEHIRGLSGDKPFGAVGDVIGLSVQEDEITVAGKAEKRTCLYADIQPNDRAVELNKADQKVYTSCEFLPNFAGSGKWGLVGLAVTDTPASIATERLQFSKVTGALIVPGREEVKFDEDAAATAFSAVADFFKKLTAAPDAQGTTQAQTQTQNPAAPVVQNPAAPAQPDAVSAFTAQVFSGMKALADAVEASSKATNEAIAELRADQAKLKTQLETTPDPTAFNRAPAIGHQGAAQIKAEC